MPSTLSSIAHRHLTHRNFRRIDECRTLIRWLDAQRGERILDIGCGDGFYDHVIAGSGARVTGIDVNRRRLAVAQRRYASDRTEFLFMDAERMEFDDESFDKVVSFCVIEHFQHDQRVLEHAHRVLKPGGLLFLSADSLSNPEITEGERDAHRRRYAVNTFYTVDILGTKLDEAGFSLAATKYILTTPLTLMLTRFSWRLDDLPEPLVALKGLGYFALLTAGRVASFVSERLAGRRDSGLTLLARARKR